jgi:hypothetical protein
MAQEDRIEQEFQVYGEWRTRLQSAIERYRDWLKEQELINVQAEQRLGDVLASISDNRLYVAFVAEYSRGKSELINAIFFADTGSRVLPSRAGRTTMCPTELYYDPETEPGLRLLPIETRTSGTSIAEYKGFPEEWTSVPLDPNDPARMSEVLQQLAEIKTVSPEEARSMGLHVAKDEAHEDGMHINEQGEVEIPKWRHALINFPHPLLKQGLVILDTPGLNALGAEPELTLNLLASAHAVMFILACDTGVTKSDLGVWRDHIRTGAQGSNRGVLVVLNKIDTLWDELRDTDEVQREIERQIRDTGRTLNMSEDSIFPVSAQKALLGKIRGDSRVLEQSRVAALEDALANTIIPAKREIVREAVRADTTDIVKATRMLIMQRVNGAHDHVAELETLNSKNVEVIEDMMAKVKADKEHLERSLQRFQATRSIFSQQTNLLYTHLNLRNLDSLIAETKKDMAISLTTAGLRSSMGKFFSQVRGSMGEVTSQAREIKELMDGVYRKFQEEHGLANVKPSSFSTTKYVRELNGIEKRHEQMLSGMSLVMTEQMSVIRRFFDSGVKRVRQVFEKASRDADAWLKNIMSPMEAQVREHQVQLRRRLESIKRIHKASDSLDERLKELRLVEEGYREQEHDLEELAAEIQRCLDSAPEDLAGDIRVEESA